MIYYKSSGINFFCNVFQLHGSVFPLGFSIAAPVALLSCVLEWLYENEYIQLDTPSTDMNQANTIMNESAAWGGFTFLVGFLIIFRTTIAYGRFWDGVTSTHKMRAEWFDSCASICAFCHHSSAKEEAIDIFQNTLIRLFSLLHAVALAEIEDTSSEELLSADAFNLELLDDCFTDHDSLIALRDSNCKPELAFQWIQQYIVENIKTGILDIPAPLLSRAFQELANGRVEFHEALKVSSIPFPFPYAQTCDFLLIVHGLMTPIVVTQWVNGMAWVFIFSFMQIFIMWSLKAIAVQLENPFGQDANDLDEKQMQEEMNHHLLLLVSTACRRTPALQSAGHDDGFTEGHIAGVGQADPGLGSCSLNTAWHLCAIKEMESQLCENDTLQTPVLEPPVRSIRVEARQPAGQVGNLRKSMSSGSLRTGPAARASARASAFGATRNALKRDLALVGGQSPEADLVVATSTCDGGIVLDMKSVPIDFTLESIDHLHLQIPTQAFESKPSCYRKPKNDYDQTKSQVNESTHDGRQELAAIAEQLARNASTKSMLAG